MRLRMFMLIAVCIALDVLVVRQVRKYDEQRAISALEQSMEDKEATVASHKEIKAGQVDVAQKSDSSTTAC